jgi:hypothetical protein
MDSFLDEPRSQGQPIYLGILGIHNKITKEDIHEKILHPLMSVFGRLPDKILLPSEGTSSAYINIWAEKQHIDTHCVEADWKKFQKKAAILRDARILKECTHLLTFLGPRSRSNEQTAIRQVKKGKQVFLVEHTPVEMYEIVVEG